jgi:protein-disulfide isomerase
MKTKHAIAILLPAIIVASFALFLRLIQYEPIFPEKTASDAQQTTKTQIPIFPFDPIIGDKKAPTTLVIFEDFACAACAELDNNLSQLMQKHPKKIKIIWKGLPVASLPFPSADSHQYAYCANAQKKFNEFKQYAFSNLDNLSVDTLDIIAQEIELDSKALATCLGSPDTQSYLYVTEQLANVLNIQSVPTIFLNDKQLDYPRTISGWETLLQL